MPPLLYLYLVHAITKTHCRHRKPVDNRETHVSSHGHANRNFLEWLGRRASIYFFARRESSKVLESPSLPREQRNRLSPPTELFQAPTSRLSVVIRQNRRNNNRSKCLSVIAVRMRDCQQDFGLLTFAMRKYNHVRGYFRLPDSCESHAVLKTNSKFSIRMKRVSCTVDT